MIGNRKGEVEAIVHRGLHDAAVEGLADGVGGDEAEAAGAAGEGFEGGLVPPEHDEVGALGHRGVGGAKRLGVAVAKVFTHPARAEERRVADDEVGLRPDGGARVDEGVERADGLFVGDFAAGDGIDLKRAAVPDELGFAVGAFGEVFFVVGEDGVAALDVVELFEDGLGGGCLAVDAEVPLEVADPEDEFGEGGGALVDLQAEELVGIDGRALKAKDVGFTEVAEEVDDLAFESLHLLKRDVEEVARAAGGIEHADGAELGVELVHLGLGGLEVAALGERDGGDTDGGPFVAERLDHGGEDEAFRIGARGVVRAEFVAFVGREGAFEEGAEDGGLDVAPFEGGGFAEERELGGGDGKGLGGGKEAAVEVEELFLEEAGEAALVHVLEEKFEHGHESAGVGLNGVEEAEEGVFGEEADVLGEHAEEAAGKELGDEARLVAFLEGFGEFGKVAGDFAGDLGGLLGRVEG